MKTQCARLLAQDNKTKTSRLEKERARVQTPVSERTPDFKTCTEIKSEIVGCLG